MGKPLYKSLYVIARKRDDGMTYGILRNRPSNLVNCFDTPEEALEHSKEYGSLVGDEIVLDIGLLLDQGIKRKGKFLDASVRYEPED